MNEIDQLAAAVVQAVAHIIALPIRISVWVARAAKRSLKKPHFVGLAQWKSRSSKRRQAKVAKKGGNSPSSLDKFKLSYEDVPDKKIGRKNGRSRNSK